MHVQQARSETNSQDNKPLRKMQSVTVYISLFPGMINLHI